MYYLRERKKFVARDLPPADVSDLSYDESDSDNDIKIKNLKVDSITKYQDKPTLKEVQRKKKSNNK